MTRVPLDRIDPAVWSQDLNPLDPDRVAALAAEGEARQEFEEPIHVAPRGGRFVLLDGRHRVEAARRLGWDAIVADVHPCAHEADALALAVQLGAVDLPPETARALAARLAEAVAADDRRAAHDGPLDPRRQALLRELLLFLHESRRIQDARLAQLFDLGDATAAARLRMDSRGLPVAEPLALHEMPQAVVLGIRELMAEGLLAREEIEHLFPLNDRERLHLRAERALRLLAGPAEERVKLRGSRWGPDYRSGAPQEMRVVAEWADGRICEIDLADIPGLDKHTIGIIRKVFHARAELVK